VKIKSRKVLVAALFGLCGWSVVGLAKMTVASQFAVNEGAATFAVPINLLPGVAGLQPSLSLNYSSQAGNGLVGVGWSLSGLSRITRCPQTLPQDGVHGVVNYDLNDRYCLNGQRLLAIRGKTGVRSCIPTFAAYPDQDRAIPATYCP
jgi:hypothetical protein